MPRCWLPLLLLPALSGCYVLQAASGQADVLARSEPIDTVLAAPDTPPAVRARLELAQQARAFAVDELALPDGRSFRKYADLERPYAVWNVVATPEFATEPRRWCLPVAGCVAYRGYFEEARAAALAQRLMRDGYDATVGGVATYSTLGRLPDPVFNTMLGWSETRFVGTIFHELAHERLYVAGDSEFNEAFASVVEREGLRQWLLARGDTAAIERHRQAADREAEFAALLRAARTRLGELYASGADVATLRVEKQREFGRLKFEYTLLRARWGGYAGYDTWFSRTLNNAHLASLATYHDCVPGLERELAAAGSLPAFYERAAVLAELPLSQRRAAVCAVPELQAS
ncbi:MAG: aminopeptidase [Steroidobacteraceae bacterium]|nr:aminopeptidase [Steroidobacteraceae bacterium]